MSSIANAEDSGTVEGDRPPGARALDRQIEGVWRGRRLYDLNLPVARIAGRNSEVDNGEQPVWTAAAGDCDKVVVGVESKSSNSVDWDGGVAFTVKCNGSPTLASTS